jgi:integrase
MTLSILSRTSGRNEMKPNRRRVKLYDLRHTYTSHVIDGGVKPMDLAHHMGHSEPAATLVLRALAGDTSYVHRLTAARQATGDLRMMFVKTRKGQKAKND